MNQHGFSAVELLITLFIATIFLIAGYQIWGEVMGAGTKSDYLAKASNISYDYLRRYSIQPAKCAVSTPVNNTAITDQVIGQAKVTVKVSCPYGTTGDTNIKLITSTVSYGSTSTPQEVTHAMYIN